MNYYKNREALKARARQHTVRMEKNYPERIRKSVDESRIYGSDAIRLTYIPRKDMEKPAVVFANTDSVSALFAEGSGKTAILNFASYKNPGGMFYEGSSAQEESLCHESFLYNVLSDPALKAYYSWNNKNKNRSLYLDRAVYTPEVVFIHEGKGLLADVITCAAPNFSAASRYLNVSKEENNQVLKNRIVFIRDIAETEGVKTLIAGAYGCGVFGQDPEIVAKYFSEAFKKSSVKKIVYAVPGKDRNTKIFEKYFG